MRYAWMFIFTVLIAGAIAFLAWYRYRINSIKRSKKHAAIIAHTSSIKQLPAYKKARKRYYILLGVAAFFLATTLFSFTAIAARPVEIRADKRINATRDTILCLDMSGSMEQYSTELLSRYSDIVSGLNGERVGITIFDSVPVNILPLTDDYAMAKEVLSDLNVKFVRYRSAINRNNAGLSNIGSGVMGCINSFDTLGDERTQSIIVATDNIDEGNKKVSHEQAASYGKRYGVSLYGISVDSKNEHAFPSSYDSVDDISELGGNDSKIPTILNRIFEQEAVKVETARELIAVDTPEVFIMIGIISFTALMITLWRLHL